LIGLRSSPEKNLEIIFAKAILRKSYILKMLKILLKLWPALLPIAIYFVWILLQRFFQKRRQKRHDAAEKIIGESSTENKSKAFSLRNRFFVFMLYASLILAIAIMIRAGL